MLKQIITFCIIILLFVTSVPRATAVTLTNVVGKISSSEGTYLRTGAGTSYPSIRLLPKDTPLTMIGTSSDWFKVRTLDGTTGYVSSRKTVLTGQGSPSTIITRGNVNRKMVALTFDAGADRGYAEKILDILKTNGTKATFGITRDWAQSNQSLAKRVVNEGHEFINHTLHHSSYTGASTGEESLSPAKRLSHLVATEQRFQLIMGRTAKPMWRPPYADYNSGVLRDVGALGYSKTIMWDIDSFGWNGYTTDQIYNHVTGKVQNGSIILFHVGSQSQDANVLQRIINNLKNRGYSFGTVTQVTAP